MSYSEENGQVVLRMSREDYDRIANFLVSDAAANSLIDLSDRTGSWERMVKWQQLLNRLNSGNPNYTPYKVEEKK